eukprot:8450773-Alexandrium_andersonii.AAC.1
MAAGALAGHRGQAVQGALEGRCEVSREQVRLWAAAFGRRSRRSAVPGATEEEVLSEEEPAQE